jgi:hypothetical protein
MMSPPRYLEGDALEAGSWTFEVKLVMNKNQID